MAERYATGAEQRVSEGIVIVSCFREPTSPPIRPDLHPIDILHKTIPYDLANIGGIRNELVCRALPKKQKSDSFVDRICIEANLSASRP